MDGDISVKRTTPTQVHRVARALRFAGARGITQADFDPPALDGLPPIRRLASRINDLRDAGWKIDSRGRRLGMARYVLVTEPNAESEDSALGAAESSDSATGLFSPDVGHARPVNAIVGEVDR